MNSESYQKIIVFNSITELVDTFNDKPNLKNQLDELMQTSFPLQLPLSSSFIDNMKLMVKKGKIDSKKVITILAVLPRNGNYIITGCIQLVKSNTNVGKTLFTIINLCRFKNNVFKGTGKLLLDCAFKYVRNVSPKTKHVYLSVSANNTKLQEYYQKLGWIKTHEYDYSSDSEPAFKMVYIL